MPELHAVLNAREAFPRGLEQPQGCLRFGADALLLAAFAARHTAALPASPGRRLAAAELGCGCGAALLGLALCCPTVHGLGLDREIELVRAAQRNALALGLAERLLFAAADLADTAALRNLPHPLRRGRAAGTLDVALANPPFDVKGRPSPRPLRERALRTAQDDADALTLFCRAAAALLRQKGHFFCICHAPSLPRMCVALHAAGLGVRRMLPVRPHRNRPATRVLIEARRGAAHDMVLETPLTLHAAGHAAARRWTAAALRFCPWLA